MEFLAAVLGALVGAIGGYVARHVRDVQQERSQFNTARELTKSDLEAALDAVNRALERGSWPTGASSAWVQAWTERRASLVSRLSRADYDTIARAFARTDELENGLNASRPPDRYALDSTDREFLQEMRDLLEPAVSVLRR
jgi:hypothetical protein